MSGLTAVEQRLEDCVKRGELLDLVGSGPVDDAAMQSWGTAQQVSADVIRRILLGSAGSPADPRGLRLRGARIAGRLDLENVDTPVSLELFNCFLAEGIVARDARLPGLTLEGCLLTQPNGDPSKSEPLDAARLQIASILNLSGSVVDAANSLGAVCLVGAKIGGQLACRGAKMRNGSGPALVADRLVADDGVSLRGGFVAEGAGEGGAVRLVGAKLGGPLSCHGATMRNGSGLALHADRMVVDGDVSLAEGFVAEGAGQVGAVRLGNSKIGGQFDCRGATITNKSGPALLAHGLIVDRGVSLDEGFIAEGSGEDGAVGLIGARIGGQLNCHHATMLNRSGPALLADGVTVDHNVVLGAKFVAVCIGEDGAVRLIDAKIGGQFDCRGAEMRNRSGPVLEADRMSVEQGAFIAPHIAEGAGARGTVSLETGRIGRYWHFSWSRVHNTTHPHARVGLNGLIYDGVPTGASFEQWLKLLRDGMPHYTSQPYQHLAAMHRADGHDREARKILMQQRQHQIESKALTGPSARAWARFTGFTLGYGYQPWRMLIGLFIVVAFAVVLCLIPDVVRHTKNSPTPGASCGLVERVGVALDIGLPLVKTTARTKCDAATSRAGDWFIVAEWLLQLLSWACATLFVAGFTTAVRKA